MIFGKGDFLKVIKVLQVKKSSEFKDIANKLVLIKTGHLYRKGTQIDVNSTDPNNIGIQLFKNENYFQENRLPLFGDKKFDLTKENRSVNYKHVFRVWVRQVYMQNQSEGMIIKQNDGASSLAPGATVDTDSLTQLQMENIFPEFRARLQLYAQCCNEKGQIVKNFDYYKQYRQAGHKVKGTRGRTMVAKKK